jgi:hypothetical protein
MDFRNFLFEEVFELINFFLQVFLIICIIIHCSASASASAYTPGVGLNGGIGLGGHGFTASGLIPSETTEKRTFDLQQNLLYKDPNLKQTFESPAKDVPIKVLFNRHSYNGFQVQEQQIPGISFL